MKKHQLQDYLLNARILLNQGKIYIVYDITRPTKQAQYRLLIVLILINRVKKCISYVKTRSIIYSTQLIKVKQFIVYIITVPY